MSECCYKIDVSFVRISRSFQNIIYTHLFSVSLPRKITEIILHLIGQENTSSITALIPTDLFCLRGRCVKQRPQVSDIHANPIPVNQKKKQKILRFGKKGGIKILKSASLDLISHVYKARRVFPEKAKDCRKKLLKVNLKSNQIHPKS